MQQRAIAGLAPLWLQGQQWPLRWGRHLVIMLCCWVAIAFCGWQWWPLPTTELVVIDGAVPHPEFFTAQLQPGQHGLVVPSGSPLATVTAQLEPYHHLQAIHLVTHGAPGQVYLADATIDLEGLSASNRPGQDTRSLLAQLRQSLRPGGDLLLYGCEVGAYDSGRAFLTRLHELTEADIAASIDRTGNVHRHGNWHLEATQGSVTASWDLTGNYSAVLAHVVVSTHADSGEGSLRQAITIANVTAEDDLITWAEDVEPIVLQSPLPTVTSDLALQGQGNTISGNEQFPVLHVRDSNLRVRNLTIADGVAQGRHGHGAAGGGAGLGGGLFIDNANVTLSQVQFEHNRAIGGNGGERFAPHLSKSELAREPQAMVLSQVSSPINASEGPPQRDWSQYKQRFQPSEPDQEDTETEAATEREDAPPQPEDDAVLSEVGGVKIISPKDQLAAEEGAIAGINGIGIGGIGSIAFGGGGGFGGFANAGYGGNGGDGATPGGNGGNGGDGGNGGVGIFGGYIPWPMNRDIDTVAYDRGTGLAGFANGGNGAPGQSQAPPIATGGQGGNGGNGGFGGGGGGGGFGGFGGFGGYGGVWSEPGQPGQGGFGGGDGELGAGGGGAGFGGAIFFKSGRLILDETTFVRNAAIAGQGAHPGQAKGGAIFSLPSLDADNTADIPIITLGGSPSWEQNTAADAGDRPDDTPNQFGPLRIFPDASSPPSS